jgi:hypothetical protein
LTEVVRAIWYFPLASVTAVHDSDESASAVKTTEAPETGFSNASITVPETIPRHVTASMRKTAAKARKQKIKFALTGFALFMEFMASPHVTIVKKLSFSRFLLSAYVVNHKFFPRSSPFPFPGGGDLP